MVHRRARRAPAAPVAAVGPYRRALDGPAVLASRSTTLGPSGAACARRLGSGWRKGAPAPTFRSSPRRFRRTWSNRRMHQPGRGRLVSTVGNHSPRPAGDARSLDHFTPIAFDNFKKVALRSDMVHRRARRAPAAPVAAVGPYRRALDGPAVLASRSTTLGPSGAACARRLGSGWRKGAPAPTFRSSPRRLRRTWSNRRMHPPGRGRLVSISENHSPRPAGDARSLAG